MNHRLLFSGLLQACLASILSACTASGPANAGLGGGGGDTATGTGTWTGTDACTRCWPPCYTDLLQQCIPHGMCTAEDTSSNGIQRSNACFENGVKMRSTLGDASYYKSDGHLCYYATWGDDHGVWTTTLTGEFGDVITDRDPDDGTHTVTCGGQTYIVDATSADCAACPLEADGIWICTPGSCTLP
ncbi:MAG: hypothetical protein QM820_27300 [Minicystis sp.]